MSVREITAYQCSDGSLHAREENAKAHDDDLLGMELDGLLKMFRFDGSVTRNMEYRALVDIMKDRAELLKVLRGIVKILEHSESEGD